MRVEVGDRREILRPLQIREAIRIAWVLERI